MNPFEFKMDKERIMFMGINEFIVMKIYTSVMQGIMLLFWLMGRVQ